MCDYKFKTILNNVIVKWTMEDQAYASVAKNVKFASLNLTFKLIRSFYFKISWAPPSREELPT